MNRFRSLPLGLFVGSVALLLMGACGPPAEPPRAETAAAIPVRVETVQPMPFEDFYEAAGTVRARQRAAIASRISGTLLAVRVKPGDVVREGQALAEIEDDELRAEASSAEAAKAAAETAQTVADQGRAAAEAAAHLAAITFERYRDLLEKRSVSRQEYDQAEERHRAAQAALRMAEARVAEARARREQADGALRAAQIRAGYSRITAPFAGVVVEKQADAGTVVAPGMPLFTLDAAGGYQLEASVPETQVGKVRLGEEVRVVIPAGALEMSGRVEEIEPAADAGSRTSRVKIGLPGRGLRSGLFGRARFSRGQENLLAVPEGAVVRKGQLLSVLVVSEGVARQRLVTLGRLLGDRHEVLSGLAAGEQVVISEVATLLDGSPVEVRP